MKWQILDTGISTAEENMETDRSLLKELSESQQPILHFYDWARPSATFGHFIQPEFYLNLEAAQTYELDLARRPTGGGIVFHTTDLAFSLLLPASHANYSINPLENYAFVNQFVIQAISQFLGNEAIKLLPEDSKPLSAACKHFCMAKPTQYDVMLHGRKIGGAAQRCTKFGFLHQGTISVMPPSESFLKRVLKDDGMVVEAMKTNSFSLLNSESTPRQFSEAKKTICALLKHTVLQSQTLGRVFKL